METDKNKTPIVLVAEDDDGHAELICDNLLEAGITHQIIRFKNGQQTLDFFYKSQLQQKKGDEPVFSPERPYMLLLDVSMPKIGGIEVLRRLKSDPQLKYIPIIMLTTTDDPLDIQNCYDLGCNCYVTKPVNYKLFSEMLTRLGLFILATQIPTRCS